MTMHFSKVPQETMMQLVYLGNNDRTQLKKEAKTATERVKPRLAISSIDITVCDKKSIFGC